LQLPCSVVIPWQKTPWTDDVIFAGRHIDVVSLWSQYVDLPPNIEHPLPMYLPKVVCPNPKHDTHKRHFQVNAKQGLVHCFAHCGISGNFEHAIQVITGCTAKEARKAILLHSRAATSDDLKQLGTPGFRKTFNHDDAVAKDQRAQEGGKFTFLPRHARDWLDTRGIEANSRGKWQIGWDEDAERITLPGYDDRNIFRFLIRRRIDGIEHGKYLYTDGAIKTSVLYGACMIDREQLDSTGLVLCEGPLDVVRLHQVGIRTAVAILGTGISAKQLRLIDKLGPKRLYLFFDRDAAGLDNILRCQASVRKVPMFVCRYAAGKSDPGEMSRELGERAIDRALPLAVFMQKYIKARNAGMTRKVA
jgi:hypothetical protein